MRLRESEADRWHRNGGPEPLPDDPPSEANDPLIVELRIANPTNGTAVEGPWNGVTVPVEGSAHVTSGTATIERVEVQFGAGGSKQAISTAGGWASWTASELIASSGSLEITARAIVNGQVVKECNVSITTTLQPKPPEPDPMPAADTTPPVVVITSPATDDTTVMVIDGQANVALAGTASDVGQGIDRVEVEVDGVPVQARQVNGSWHNWTAQGTIVGLGKHVITARALDNAGLRTEASLRVTASDTPPTPPVMERLFLVERCRLSSFLGAYGPGRTIKTLSLLPGEKTTIAVKSYRRTEGTETETASILDSNTNESQQDFENTLSLEQSNKRAVEESSSWTAQAHGEAKWGWGNASISGGAAGASNASREELGKNITSAVQKHAAKASSRRDMEVKSSREMRREEGEEFSSESQIENINVSRTLNFVFRQMNQEYITILHLVDIRIGYVRGDVVNKNGEEHVHYTYREATLSQLDGLLRMVIVRERRDEVRQAIVHILENVFDHEDEPHRMIEEKVLVSADGAAVPNGSYLRVPKGKVSKYVDPATGTQIVVPGVILSVSKNVMKTDGVVCDALLGAGEALDAYSKGLQREAVESRRLENDRQRAGVHKEQLAINLVKNGDSEGAKRFREVYPPPETVGLALVTSQRELGDPAT